MFEDQCGLKIGMKIQSINGSSVREGLAADRLGDLVSLYPERFQIFN